MFRTRIILTRPVKLVYVKMYQRVLKIGMIVYYNLTKVLKGGER